MSSSRKYWVVSPNVRFDGKTVGAWRQASVKWKAAFMGWHPNDEAHRLGPKFAYGIEPGDIILIARRANGRPETVGFGIVVGRFRTRLKGFTPPESFGSLRQLDPFLPMSRPPCHLPLMEAVNQTAALHQLHPDSNPQHAVLCRWLDTRLTRTNEAPTPADANHPHPAIKFTSLPDDGQLEYQTRTRSSVHEAQKLEAALVERYRLWIEQQDRKLQVFRIHRLRCDAYEQERSNLIEAKCSSRREYVRMAVGQLLDYSFHARDEIGDCNRAILLPDRPGASILAWLESIQIGVVWEDGSVFLDNANGQFT